MQLSRGVEGGLGEGPACGGGEKSVILLEGKGATRLHHEHRAELGIEGPLVFLLVVNADAFDEDAAADAFGRPFHEDSMMAIVRGNDAVGITAQIAGLARAAA